MPSGAWLFTETSAARTPPGGSFTMSFLPWPTPKAVVAPETRDGFRRSVLLATMARRLLIPPLAGYLAPPKIEARLEERHEDDAVCLFGNTGIIGARERLERGMLCSRDDQCHWGRKFGFNSVQ